MKVEDLFESPFKKLGNHKGVLVRSVTPDERRAEERKEKEKLAKSKDGKLAAALLEPIPNMEWEQVEKIVNDTSYGGLGGEIVDVINTNDLVMRTGDAKVACRQYTVYVKYDQEDGAGEQVSDAIKVTIYRDPTDPKNFLSTL